MVLLLLILSVKLILTVARPLSTILLDALYRLLMGPKICLPPIRNRILLMSATELAANIRKQKVTAEEAMRAYIDRIRDVDVMLNACVDQRFVEAICDARAVDMMIQGSNRTEEELARTMPLLGVPFSCKEMIGVKDLAQTNGLLHFRDRKSPSDADVVELYKKAGAIAVEVTNVPTISMWWETSNLVFGRTLNPYDNRRTVGGSTGGEAALLSAGGAVIGIGTDIGGSIRIPSAFCGVYGHKPSRGTISNQRPWPVTNPKLEPFRSTGPMCRYAQDLKMLVRILSGDSASDLRLDEEVDFKKVNIYFIEELSGWLLSATSDVKAAIRKLNNVLFPQAVDYFQETYHVTATKLNLPEMSHAFEMWQSRMLEADGPPLKKGLGQADGPRNWRWEMLKSLLGRSEFDFVTAFFASIEKEDKDLEYFRFLTMLDDLQKKLDDLLAGDAILLMPTHPEPAPYIMTTIPKLHNVGYTCIFNILGYAATNVPAGLSGHLPIGVQVVARSQDRLTLAAAVELDKVFKGWRAPCLVDV